MKSKLWRLTLFSLLVLGIGLALIYVDRIDVVDLKAWIQDAGSVGPLLFMVMYSLATVLFLPGSVLTLVGGALFGPLWGTLYSLTGATIGAALAFLSARYLASDWVERKAGGRLKRLVDGVGAEGWRFVAFVRLVPLFPFNLLNYALGLTRIRFGAYLVATWLFMLPGAAAYTYLGYAGREAVAGGEGLIQKGLVALGLLAVVVFLPRLIARFRQGPSLTVEALKQRIEQGENTLVLDVRVEEDFVGEQGHIPQARNIPLESLEARLDELENFLEHPVALVCRTDRRSAQAARILTAKGFADIHVVVGGMTAWNSRGWPVEAITPVSASAGQLSVNP